MWTEIDGYAACWVCGVVSNMVEDVRPDRVADYFPELASREWLPVFQQYFKTEGKWIIQSIFWPTEFQYNVGQKKEFQEWLDGHPWVWPRKAEASVSVYRLTRFPGGRGFQLVYPEESVEIAPEIIVSAEQIGDDATIVVSVAAPYDRETKT